MPLNPKGSNRDQTGIKPPVRILPSSWPSHTHSASVNFRLSDREEKLTQKSPPIRCGRWQPDIRCREQPFRQRIFPSSMATTVTDSQFPSQPLPGHSLGIISKYWISGNVKTRLASDLGFDAAASIQRQFMIHLSERLAAVADDRTIFTSPDNACGNMQAAAGERWLVRPQGTGDLGKRMQRAFESLMTPPGSMRCTDAILVGGDLPTLTHAELMVAFARLRQADIVLGPASDGGYYLIGLRGPWRDDYSRLFESIPWSSETVLAQTRQRIGDIGLLPSFLDMREDIDTLPALERMLASQTTDATLRDSIRPLLRPRSAPCE